MKTEHTPGPWKVQRHTRYQNESSGGPGESTYKVGYDYLLIVSENGDHPTPIAELVVSTESEANASLIAQAPALLAENARLKCAIHAAHGLLAPLGNQVTPSVLAIREATSILEGAAR